MSFKYSAQRISDNHYVLAKTGAMKIEGHALLSDDLYAASEEGLWNQLVTAASYEGVTAAYLMPDSHVGYSVPVGCVLVTDGTMVMAASGYDISCGMLLMKVEGLKADYFRNRYPRERWITEVEKRIALGIGSHRPSGMAEFNEKTVLEVMEHGGTPLGVSPHTCERVSLPVAPGTNFKLIDKAWGKASAQLGSLGGGNHFIELQADVFDGSLWVMIHSGSRGYGYQTAEHFFYRAADLRGMPSNRRGDAWLSFDEPLGKLYWAHHNSAANYAIANRHTMGAMVKRVFQEQFDADAEVYYEISHNLIQEETLVLPDGTTRRGLVHRKGATRAFPAGHPDLAPTLRWADKGHPCIVPGSMYEGAAILTPQPGAHDWACSVNHGSGRLLARGAAKRKLEHRQDDIDGEMHDIQRTFGGTAIEGIVGNTKHTPLDECAHVYKSLDEVLRTLESAGVAKIARRLYPLASIKGTD